MKSHPELSVLMTVFNGEKYLTSAVQSVLSQTFKDFEFIIINDGSTDNTGLLLDTFHDSRIKILNYNENKGVSARRQELLEMSGGEFLTFIDADDILHPLKFEKQVLFLKQNPVFGLAGSSAIIIDSDGNKTGNFRISSGYKKIRARMIFRNYFINSAVMFRAEAIRNICIPADFDYVEDYFLWWKILAFSKGINLKEKLTFYRLHSDNMTSYLESKRYERNKKIYTVILNDLGIVPQEDDIKCHYFLSNNKRVNSYRQILRLAGYLMKINHHCRITNISNYKSVLLNRWLKVCFKSIHRPDLLIFAIYILIIKLKFFLFR